ncbi:MAG: phage integrase N-terminal SAM-like domain-containing protein, partial [Candidatus Eisenbacteria sp.]|nr:phage integrase N-terminal SAM-like domain-containing protein [Candidatus Eisenbacteria bacterium]
SIIPRHGRDIRRYAQVEARDVVERYARADERVSRTQEGRLGGFAAWLRHYSPRTERSYLGWTDRYLQYLGDPRTAPPTSADAKAYLSHLATRAKVSTSTQNQAFNALLFLQLSHCVPAALPPHSQRSPAASSRFPS